MLDRIHFRTHHFRCPDEHDLAAYADQQLIGAERERVESHLSKCDSCLQQVAFLVRHAQGAASVPARFLARARQLEISAQRNRPLTWQWAGAVAAIALVAVSAALWRGARLKHPVDRPVHVAEAQRPQAAGIPGDPNPETETSVRGASPGVSLPIVLSPRAGATVPASDFIIRWQPLAGSVAYEVRVVTADGTLVWRKRVLETSVRPPAQTLQPGRKYFVWVRALLPDGETQLSTSVSFIGG
jgi:hypothetical protein